MKIDKYLLSTGLLLIVSLIVLSGCSKSAPNQAPPTTVPPPTPADEIIQGRAYNVNVLGANGFAPAELIIRKNDLVRWTNNDPQGKDMVITIQYENSREFVNSDIVSVQGTWEKVFTTSGTYTYWTIGYGVKGKVMVE